MIKVIFISGKMGEVRLSRLGKLLRLHRIAAYKPFDSWVEVRRKQKIDYHGPERRVECPF